MATTTKVKLVMRMAMLVAFDYCSDISNADGNEDRFGDGTPLTCHCPEYHGTGIGTVPRGAWGFYITLFLLIFGLHIFIFLFKIGKQVKWTVNNYCRIYSVD